MTISSKFGVVVSGALIIASVILAEHVSKVDVRGWLLWFIPILLLVLYGWMFHELMVGN